MLFQRVSFRQLLVVAFLLLAALLAGMSLRGLYTMDKLLSESRDSSTRAVVSSGDAQQMAERSTVMERAARQYVVLDDPVLRDRYVAAARDAGSILGRLMVFGLPKETADAWFARLKKIDDLLPGPRETATTRDSTLAAEFAELQAINAEIAQRVRDAGQARNRDLIAAQSAVRNLLGRQVIGAIVFAGLLALVFGVWLARPLSRLEDAIIRMGENRLEEPIEIRGPSDVREVGRRLDWLRMRLAELDADKARFLRHVSHELKTPLAALREGVSLLDEGVTGRLTESQREVVRILKQNTVTLQSQIEALLKFNAAAFDARMLVRQHTELGGLIDRLIDEQSLQWKARRLNVSVTGGPLFADVDSEKLSMALGNLLSNAIRFSPEGGNIDISLWRTPEAARIEIWDEGPGVADADRDRVFEPFYRGERQPVDAIRGSGIGLSIVNEVVTAHGGRIELLAEGPGARFRIELPHASGVL